MSTPNAHVIKDSNGNIIGINPFAVKFGSGFTVTNTNDVVSISSAGGVGGVETPVGTINGSNTTFTVSNTPVYITVNGQILYENYGYTRSSLTLTLDTAPRTGVQNGTGQDDVIRSHY